VIDWAGLGIMATSGKFKLAGPAAFTADAWQMLKGLFFLMLQHSHVPEWVWGGAIASSKASVEAQVPAWETFIELLRLTLEPDILKLMEIWTAVVSLWDPTVQAIEADEFTVIWPSVTKRDAETMLKYLEWSFNKSSLVTPETALSLADLVDDAAEEVAAAESETVGEDQRMEARIDQAMAAALRSNGRGEPEPETQ
jgi:hypothetical protein